MKRFERPVYNSGFGDDRLLRGITMSADRATPPKRRKIKPMDDPREGFGLATMVTTFLMACVAIGLFWLAWVATPGGLS